jgi:hypothetical protein
MLFSASIVNVFMWVPSFARLTVTLTFITPVPATSKAILLIIGKAKNWRWDALAACGRLRQMKGHGT